MPMIYDQARFDIIVPTLQAPHPAMPRLGNASAT